MTENNPILSRDDLSFTKRDDAGRIINWQVSHDQNENWGDKYAVGQAFLAEIAELAAHSEPEAYHAVQYALSGGGDFRRGESTTFGNTGWGEECGFSEAIARAVIDGLRARKAGQESYAPDRAPRPMHVDDAASFFKACSEAFVSLGVLFDEINATENPLAVGDLVGAGLHIAKRYADLAERWRDDLKAGGFQS
jgi:hypothetical protein